MASGAETLILTSIPKRRTKGLNVADKILEEVAEATGLREGAAGVEALVREVNRAGAVRLADAARAVRLPLPVATAVRRELEKRGLLERQSGLTFTESGRRWASGQLGLGAPLMLDVPLAPGPLTGALESLRQAVEARMVDAPSTDVTLDQAPCTADTAARRVGLLYRSGALEGRRVLMIGDDDSISLACGLLSKVVAHRPLARRLAVIDIDARRLAFLADMAARDGIAIETIHHDLREPLPPDLIGGFDTFVTDPPYTLDGARLFLTRGVEAIEAGRGQAMFSFGHTAPRERLALQASLATLGLAVIALHPAFNAYVGAAILGSTSELYELLVHARPEPGGHWAGAIYTAEINPKEPRYRCTGCGGIVTLGRNGVPSEIGKLKAVGCPTCGGRSFARGRAT